MKRFSLVMVLNQEKDKFLMCYRNNDPYKGLYNFVGGKVEEDEDSCEGAYRELFEETGITRDDIELKRFIDFVWHPLDMMMDVFIGKLNKDVVLVKEKHDLLWMDREENFFDMSKFAGEGNIGHMYEIFKQLEDRLDL
jgi:8-oxo-dGTP diphosphatase